MSVNGGEYPLRHQTLRPAKPAQAWLVQMAPIENEDPRERLSGERLIVLDESDVTANRPIKDFLIPGFKKVTSIVLKNFWLKYK